MIIKFKNWDKYQARQGLKIHPNTSWFRLENRIIQHDLWFQLNAAEFKLFIFMLCTASQNKNSGQFERELSFLSMGACVKEKEAIQTIEKLQQLQIIEVRTLQGRYNSAALLNYTKLNYNTNTSIFDFEKIYEKYPKKMGKERGLDACVKEIKTQEEYNSLLKAIDKYNQHIKGTDPRYIKHFDTFMETWKDWLDPNVGKVKTSNDYPFQELKPKQEIESSSKEKREVFLSEIKSNLFKTTEIVISPEGEQNGKD